MSRLRIPNSGLVLSLAVAAALGGPLASLAELATTATTQPAVPQWYQQLPGTSTPASEAAPKLLAELKDAAPLEREAIIRRLLPMAEVAAEPAVMSFADGFLSTRLALLELLEAWDAPVDGMDPWEPQSITPERLDQLRAWATNPDRTKVAATTQNSRPAVSIASELTRLATCQGDTEATALRERLARFGTSIREDVLQALHDHPGDTAQTRLTALRYRLIASDAIAIGWPGGLERLSARETQTRRNAVQELARRVTSAEVPLLRELFSDPDPFVRESALNTLQGLSGDAARDALAQMLEDPDPNVRAAVLKQLTEKPSDQFVNRLVEYARQEQDPDLVLHSVRALRSLKGNAVLKGLMELMRHSSWQVRAEAAEGVKEAISNLPQEKKADAYMAMVELLKDEDSFVVSRAVQCLQQADLAAALEPLLEVAQRRPELAGEVVKAISAGQNMKRMAPKHLRKFCSHADPAVRAVAIVGLCELASSSVEQEVLAALRDPDARVRLAGAQALYGLIEDLRPFATSVRLTPRSSHPSGPDRKGKPENWAASFQAGQDRPEWMLQAANACREGLTRGNAEARIRMALPLVALQADPQALDTLLQVVREDRHQIAIAAHSLLWISPEKRLELSDRLLSTASEAEEQAQIVRVLAVFSDKAAVNRLWKLLEDPKAGVDLASAVYQALLKHYVGDRYYDSATIASLDRKGIVTQLAPYSGSGTELQRCVALALMVLVDAKEAAAHAHASRLAPNASEWQRLDGLQIELLALPPDKGIVEAVAVMRSDDRPLRKAALPYLAGLRNHLQQLRGGLYVNSNTPDTNRVDASEKPMLPTYPAGLDEAVLRDIFSQGDDAQRPLAAYLLALKGNKEALTALIDYSRTHPDRQYRWLVVRAIAVSGDDDRVPMLQEIYGAFSKEDYEIREFYWTIRGMQGANALKLRKQIRDEVGMSRLR